MDDIDDLLRRAMKTLDERVPEGYFEALPSKVQGALARSEDSSMQATGTSDSNRDASTGVPPMTKESREEDSGLHDIRSLASSTKARLSSRRSTANPIMTEDDVLASSSAGWKAVALPEPAKMISLPELADLPSAKEVKAREKAAAKAAKASESAARSSATEIPAARSSGSLPMIPVAAPAVAEAAPATSASSMPSIGSRIAAQKSGNKNKTLAFVGVGLAAAAGVTFFVVSQNGKKEAATEKAVVAAGAPAAEYHSNTKMLPPPPPAAAPATATADMGQGSGAAEQVAQIAAPEAPVEAAKPVAKGAGKESKPTHKVEIRDTSMTDRARDDKEKEKTAPKDDKKVQKQEGGDGEPSFDALLKEAGVSDAKKDAKPKLDKKSLSGADIKTGMAAVTGKASSCYQGTQGTATVKLTVAPSGQVSKVTVTGVFAGTPVAACVEAAVRSASFPPWDGGPQSFGYSYLLSE